MLKTKPRLATYADLEALPSNMVGEIIRGVLYAHRRPTPRHARAATRMSSELDGPFDRGSSGPGGWIFLIEPELHLDKEAVVPDIAGWWRERLTPFPDTAFITTSPDRLAEVLSPSTQALDRTDKLAIYAAHGVAHCWYVDPLARTLEVMALTGGKSSSRPRSRMPTRLQRRRSRRTRLRSMYCGSTETAGRPSSGTPRRLSYDCSYA